MSTYAHLWAHEPAWQEALHQHFARLARVDLGSTWTTTGRGSLSPDGGGTTVESIAEPHEHKVFAVASARAMDCPEPTATAWAFLASENAFLLGARVVHDGHAIVVRAEIDLAHARFGDLPALVDKARSTATRVRQGWLDLALDSSP